MDKKQVQWMTVGVAVVFIAAIVLLAILGTPEMKAAMIPIVGGVGVAITAAMKQAFEPADKKDDNAQ